MKYFLDTEFIEHFKKPIKWLPTFGSFNKPFHTIELISIGLMSSDGREYYAVSNEFNPGDADDWVRKNVIDKIEAQLFQQQPTFAKSHFNFSLKELLKQYGKSNKQIAEEVEQFCKPNQTRAINAGIDAIIGNIDPNIEFYGYYADYDWVLFCSLFGRMIDLPKGFPMMCFDIEQLRIDNDISKDELIAAVPQINEHNALSDAKWNANAYLYIESIKNGKRR